MGPECNLCDHPAPNETNMNRRILWRSAAIVPLLVVAAAASTSLPLPKIPYRVEDPGDVQARYELLAGSADSAGLQDLWRDQPGSALTTFDADLERSLALREKSPEQPPLAEIAALHDRALLAARAASDALGTPIFADYASAFVGWSEQEQRDFRDGQMIVKEAHKLLAEGEAMRAQQLAQDAIDRTAYLGDWWGNAMAYAVRGRAQQASSSFQHALTSYAQARLIYNQLHLTGSEFTNLHRMVNMLVLLEHWPRAQVACEAALRMAPGAGAAEKTVAELERARTKIDKALGAD